MWKQHFYYIIIIINNNNFDELCENEKRYDIIIITVIIIVIVIYNHTFLRQIVQPFTQDTFCSLLHTTRLNQWKIIQFLQRNTPSVGSHAWFSVV